MLKALYVALVSCCVARADPRRLLFASSPRTRDVSVAPASFWPTPIEDLGPCEAPWDNDAVLRAARLEKALAFVGTPFQIDAWVATGGMSVAQSEMASLLENITTPNVTQTVYETAAWSGSKFVEYQFLSSAAFNGGLFEYLQRKCEPGRCVFTSKPSSRTLDASVTVEIRTTDLVTGTVSGPTTGIERSILTFENCAPRITSIHTDLAAGSTLPPDENFATVSNNKFGRVLQMCSNHLLFCRGELAEYSDLDDCVARMRAKPGVCYNFFVKGDTVDCRMLHLLLARSNPTAHCPHMAEASEVCGFDDCPGGLCGYANTHFSPDFFTAGPWQQSKCPPPLPPTETPLSCIETCADDIQGLLAVGGVTCGQVILAGCKTSIATLSPDAGLPADVLIEELCPLACEQCVPRCDSTADI